MHIRSERTYRRHTQPTASAALRPHHPVEDLLFGREYRRHVVTGILEAQHQPGRRIAARVDTDHDVSPFDLVGDAHRLTRGDQLAIPPASLGKTSLRPAHSIGPIESFPQLDRSWLWHLDIPQI